MDARKPDKDWSDSLHFLINLKGPNEFLKADSCDLFSTQGLSAFLTKLTSVRMGTGLSDEEFSNGILQSYKMMSEVTHTNFVRFCSA